MSAQLNMFTGLSINQKRLERYLHETFGFWKFIKTGDWKWFLETNRSSQKINVWKDNTIKNSDFWFSV